jgi:hypothetical protein
MNLFAVVVGGVYPQQCVTVMERESSAKALAEHLNDKIRNVVTVQNVDSFFPSGMTDADPAWLAATTAYMRGAHHNTSGNPA